MENRGEKTHDRCESAPENRFAIMFISLMTETRVNWGNDNTKKFIKNYTFRPTTHFPYELVILRIKMSFYFYFSAGFFPGRFIP